MSRTGSRVSGILFAAILAMPFVTAQAQVGNDQAKMYVEWLEGNWGEVNKAGEDVLGGCQASQKIDSANAIGLTQKNRSLKRRNEGLLAFSSKGGTQPDRVFVSSGYDHVNRALSENSLIQVWYDAEGVTSQIGIQLSQGEMFMNFHFDTDIPGLSAYRTLVPTDSDVITLTSGSGEADSNLEERHFKRCE